MPDIIQIQEVQSSKSSSTSSHQSKEDPPSMKMIGVQGRVTTKSSGSKEETQFKSKIIQFIFLVKITTEERKPSGNFQNKSHAEGLLPAPRAERRRLSENPRNINLLHDVPRPNNRVYRKRRSARSARPSKRGSCLG